jgi:MFS family permease
VLISLLGGSLIDSKGPRIMMILTAIICVLGQGIFVIGGFTNKWIAMLIGRCVFGIGGEVLHAAQYTLISRWFKAS